MTGTRVTRRSMLGSVGAASLAPALAASDAGAGTQSGTGIASLFDPSAPHLRAAFAAELQLAAAQDLPQPGARWAAITGGEIAGGHLSGRIQGGRVDWQADPASQCTQVTLCFAVQCADGSLVEVRDRGVCAGPGMQAAASSISTAPQLLGPAGDLPDFPAMLVGRLDTTDLARGTLRLLAFEVA